MFNGAHASDDGLPIKKALKEGTSVKYSMSVDFDVNGGQGHLQAVVIEKVITVDKDGNYTIEQSQSEASGTYNGEKLDVPARLPIRLTYKPNGQVTNIKETSDTTAKSTLIDAMSYRMENLATIIDPGKGLAVGDLWTGSLKADKALGTIDVKFDYKVVALEKIGDIDSIRIKGTGRESDGDRPAQNEFTQWLSKGDRSLVQMEAKWTNAPFPGVSFPVTATVKMTRLPNT